MLVFFLALGVTLGVSFICSLMEAMILSTSVGEIEALKRTRARAGQHLEALKHGLDETIATILTLNTLANSIGSMVIGRQAAALFSEQVFAFVTAGVFITILLLSEALPKNIGVLHRRSLQPVLATPLWTLRRFLAPVNWVCAVVVRLFVRTPPAAQDSDEEILLLAERGAKEGTLTTSESRIIANALSLDDVRVNSIMTPRSVVTALRRSATIGDICREASTGLPFARLPVFSRNLDDVVGLVRRRDILRAKANDQDNVLVEALMQEIQMIPETATIAQALQLCLKTHQQLLVCIDEFGSTAGVVSMEDIMEHLLGREIFEKDDLAVDMRELARAKQKKQAAPRRPGETLAPWGPRLGTSTTTPPLPPSATPPAAAPPFPKS